MRETAMHRNPRRMRIPKFYNALEYKAVSAQHPPPAFGKCQRFRPFLVVLRI